jgi:predicted MFS family arabinose efflux permease
VTFGMARYGYGLLLPDIARDYGLGPAALGAIGTSAYASYLVGVALTGAFAARVGPRRTAVLAGVLACAGMTVAGATRSPAGLLAGILVAGASAGLAFPPFSDAAVEVAPAARGRVLAAISCGTGYGVAVAAPLAVLAGSAWRTTWLCCAAIALAATAWTARVLPRGPARRADGSAPGPATAALAALADRRFARLLVAAVLVGLGSSAFWTFAVERLVDAGALSQTASRLFLGLVGVASILGTASAAIVRRLGARRAYGVATLAEAGGIALLALAPGSLPAAIAAAVLFGSAYNATVAIQVLWSVHLVADRPSLGLAAAMAGNGAGLLAGPLAAGALAGALGLGPVLVAGAGVLVVAGLLGPRERVPA